MIGRTKRALRGQIDSWYTLLLLIKIGHLPLRMGQLMNMNKRMKTSLLCRDQRSASVFVQVPRIRHGCQRTRCAGPYTKEVGEYPGSFVKVDQLARPG